MKKIRTVLVLFVATMLLFGVWGLKQNPNVLPGLQEALRKPIAPPKTFEEIKGEVVAKIKEQEEGVKGNVETVDLSALAGYKLGGLYANYLGLTPGRPVPDRVVVSFEERMAHMYHRKVEYKRCKTDKKSNQESCIVASDTVLSHSPRLLEDYLKEDKMKMTLSEFIRIADDKVELAKRSIDWAGLCRSRAYKLDRAKCALLQSIVKDLKGRDMVAYGMTELLSSDNGTLNAKYLDLLLRNAGAEFLYHVPALGDRYASLGLYQFTFFALRDDDEEVAGSNVVNAFVKEGGDKIPGSVVMLSGHQHHTAAFYFAVHNLASMLSRLSSKEVATLQSIHRKQLDEMVVIVACAHHTPKYTFTTVSHWLHAVDEANHPKPQKGKGKAKKVSSHTDLITLFPRSADANMYAKKSKANLVAVYAWGQ